MTGLLMRLAGPMQSWGEHSTFSKRDTNRFPTRSGLIGLIAAAFGRRRTESIDDLARLRFTIRIDRAGERTVDFHTVGGGLPRAKTVPTSDGRRRSSETATIVSWRYYLMDAVFTVAVEGPDDIVKAAGRALQTPAWAPYLGRRSCPAELPLVIRASVRDPVGALHSRVPLALREVAGKRETVEVEFVYEDGDASHARHELNDVPTSFHPLRRAYLGRPAFVKPAQLPAGLCRGLGAAHLRALREYIEGDTD